jgi:hypothetical protein
MIISLAVTGMIVTLAGSAALGQLRFFKGVGAVTAVRTQVNQAALIAANVVRDIGSAADILVATDSALEAAVTYGWSFTCRTDTGRLVVASAGPATGFSFGSFTEHPQAGDDARLLVSDSTGSDWVRLHLANSTSVGPCPRFGSDAWSIPLVEGLVIPAGAPVRFLRRARLSVYRASDGEWYLGLRDWNAGLGRFNTVQPVAGPLLPYSANAATTGFRLEYRDRSGSILSSPADPARVALISMIVRGKSANPVRTGGLASGAAPFYADSAVASVAVPSP